MSPDVPPIGAAGVPWPPMLARIHSLLGVLLLGGFLVHHLLSLGPVTGGAGAWLIAHPEAGSGGGLTAVVVVVLLLHGALGIARRRRAPADGATGAGLGRLQLVTGLLALLFVLYHLGQVWAHVTTGDRPAHAAAYDSYAALWRTLGSPLDLGIYIVGISALCFHLGHGLARLPATWGLSLGFSATAHRDLLARVFGGLIGIALWLGFLQILGHFALGEPLLPGGPNPLHDLAAPDARR